jgi:hypothetical protein
MVNNKIRVANRIPDGNTGKKKKTEIGPAAGAFGPKSGVSLALLVGNQAVEKIAPADSGGKISSSQEPAQEKKTALLWPSKENLATNEKSPAVEWKRQLEAKSAGGFCCGDQAAVKNKF